MAALTGEQFNKWKSNLEQELARRLRDSLRDQGNLDPLFQIDVIPKRTDEGGFGIAAADGPNLDAALRSYADETGFIEIDMDSREFRLTDNGRTHIKTLDTR